MGALRVLRDLNAAFAQITFNGPRAVAKGQSVLYVTERGVFKLQPEGLQLIEVAPGIDIERDVLAHMAFRPIVGDVALMDPRICYGRACRRCSTRMHGKNSTRYYPLPWHHDSACLTPNWARVGALAFSLRSLTTGLAT
jgi:hypothetical protein